MYQQGDGYSTKLFRVVPIFMGYRSQIRVRDNKQFYYSIAHLVILGLSEKDLVILSQPTLKLRQAWLISPKESYGQDL